MYIQQCKTDAHDFEAFKDGASNERYFSPVCDYAGNVDLYKCY